MNRNECFDGVDSRAEHVGLVISFNMLGSYLLRDDPRDCELLSEAFWLATAGTSSTRDVEAFLDRRRAAEISADIAAQAADPGRVASIEEVYDTMDLRGLCAGRDMRRRLVRSEFAAMLTRYRINPQLRLFHRQLRAMNIRSGYVCAGRWNRRHLLELLRLYDPTTGFDFLYAGCDRPSGEGTSLIARFVAAEGVAPERCVHIGGLPDFDVMQAQQAGVIAIYYDHVDAARSIPASTAVLSVEQAARAARREMLRAPAGLTRADQRAMLEALLEEEAPVETGDSSAKRSGNLN